MPGIDACDGASDLVTLDERRTGWTEIRMKRDQAQGAEPGVEGRLRG